MTVVVSDTTPLIYLVLIDAAELLPRRFSAVLIPPAVARELSHPGTPQQVRDFIANPPAWLQFVTPKVVNNTLGLDAGETEAISVAMELKVQSILIDERKGRRVAAQCGLVSIGTLAILEKSAENGWIDFAEYIGRLRKTLFRIDERLIAEAHKRLQSKLLP